MSLRPFDLLSGFFVCDSSHGVCLLIRLRGGPVLHLGLLYIYDNINRIDLNYLTIKKM